MTEFLKGYAAGANDMEAGRLVTPKMPRKRIDLTAEEAILLLGELLEGHRISMADWSRIEAKLSLIANGENDG